MIWLTHPQKLQLPTSLFFKKSGTIRAFNEIQMTHDGLADVPRYFQTPLKRGLVSQTRRIFCYSGTILVLHDL